jgi:Plant protein of unknown function
MEQAIEERPRRCFREAGYCPTIFRAPFHIRYSRESDFEPRFVSIGPYFHGRENLSAMEVRKLQFALDLIEKLPEEHTEISTLIERFGNLTKRARACYKDLNGFSSDDFVKLLVLDSCFIIRLILSIFEEVNDNAVVLNATSKRYGLIFFSWKTKFPSFLFKKSILTSKHICACLPFQQSLNYS